MKMLSIRNSAVIVVMALLGMSQVSALSTARRIEKYLNSLHLCATVDFNEIRVNVKDGITERDADEDERVRAGDRIYVLEADVSSEGMDLEIEVTSVHTRKEHVDVELVFYRELVHPETGELNTRDLRTALGYFTTECSDE